MDRMGLGSRNIRIIGNKEWHSIANVSLASNYTTTYSNDFFVAPDDSLALEFQSRYLTEYGLDPIRLSYSGYDVANFITSLLPRFATNPQSPLYMFDTRLFDSWPMILSGAFLFAVMALANRVGKEDGMHFAGESFVTSPFGQVVAQASKGKEAILYADIDLSDCAESPARKLFMHHRRPDQYGLIGREVAQVK